jgi:rSAM/selenodomain-associated transferase 1
MSKSPELGRVKTRMQPYLTQEQSLQLHIELTQHVLPIWNDIKSLSVELWIGGDIEKFKRNVTSPLERSSTVKNDFSNVSIHSQPEGDLGWRMSYAVKSALLRGASGVFLVGTDCPFIDEIYLLQAIEKLDNNDVVLGPANDGGYVLMGLKKYYSELFENIPWGTSSVLVDTKRVIKKKGLVWDSLCALSDIDLPSDLPLLAEKNIYY